MKMYPRDDTGDLRGDYIGYWYDGQTQPQPLYIELDGENQTYQVDWGCEIGNAVPEGVWHSRRLRIGLPYQILTDREASEIITENEADLKAILESYAETKRNGNTVGTWDDDLVMDLTFKLMEPQIEPELGWFEE